MLGFSEIRKFGFKIFFLILLFGLLITGCGGNATVSSITVSPSSASVGMNKTQQFTATAYDPNGKAILASFTWSVTGSGGTISSGGLFTAGGSLASCTVVAASGSITGSSTVNIVNTGNISGRVKKSSGNGVSGISVYLTSTPSLSASTDSSGDYTISGVVPATYEVRTRENVLYISSTAEAVVATGETTTADITLSDRFSITNQNITVSYVAGYITNNGTTSATGVTIAYMFSNAGTYVGGGLAAAGTLTSSEARLFSAPIIPNVPSYTDYTRTIAATGY